MNNMVNEVEKTRERIVNNNLQAVLAQMKIMQERIDRLEGLVMTQHEQFNELNQKYNLLLTARFNGGSTEV